MSVFPRVVEVLPTPEAVARRAADIFCRRALESVTSRNRFTVSLAGGATPRRLYELLAEELPYREQVPWEVCHFFFGDERHVPPEHPDSNYGLVQRTLLSRVPVPPSQCHRVHSELHDPREAAQHYEATLRKFFRSDRPPEAWLDLALLGMGTDGHTASLFPGSPALQDRRCWVAAVWVGKLGSSRITLTPRALNRSALAVFLVTGASKAGVVREVLEGATQPRRLPAQAIRPRKGRLVWLLDREAAAELRVDSGGGEGPLPPD